MISHVNAFRTMPPIPAAAELKIYENTRDKQAVLPTFSSV
jgi:hypothetical protein